MSKTPSPTKVRPLNFPNEFAWGFASAASHHEGASRLDAVGDYIMDHLARSQGGVVNGDCTGLNGHPYERFDQDFKLMRSLGAKNYRLSLAWPRIFPEGYGAGSTKGLDFYHRLFDSMELHGLIPWVTMFDWDLTRTLQGREGGLMDRRFIETFAQYADTIVKVFSDRVKNWITLNEIHSLTACGYDDAQQVAGSKLPARIVNQVYHHALLCHGEGVRAVREFGGKGARVGLTDKSGVTIPVTETLEDITAARVLFRRMNWRTIDPIYRRGYDPAYLRSVGKDRPEHKKSDFDLISLNTDFMGLNVYSGHFVRAGKRGCPEVVEPPASFPQTACPSHKITPQSLYWGPRHLSEIYGEKTIYITENGCAYNDVVSPQGEILDLGRRELIRSYLSELHRSISDGIPVKGYFLWSFIDGVERNVDLDRRFGVVYCDYKTQKRTPKLSADWYREVMKRNCLV